LVARRFKETRDANWIATEKDGDKDVPVNRTDAIGFIGGAQNTNEECYLITKMGRMLGTVQVEHQARL
jgi:formate dehydrogenase major subunit